VGVGAADVSKRSVVIVAAEMEPWALAGGPGAECGDGEE